MRVVLEGGPDDLPASTIDVARPVDELKLPHRDGYEHFRRTARQIESPQGPVPVYEWFERTEAVS